MAWLCGVGICVTGVGILLCTVTGGAAQHVLIGLTLGAAVATVFCGIQFCIGQPRQSDIQ